MKRYTVRIRDKELIQHLDNYLQSNVPQNTLLCGLLEQALNHATPQMTVLAAQLDRIESMLEQGTVVVAQPDNGSKTEPAAAASGLSAMLGGFTEGRR